MIDTAIRKYTKTAATRRKKQNVKECFPEVCKCGSTRLNVQVDVRKIERGIAKNVTFLVITFFENVGSSDNFFDTCSGTGLPIYGFVIAKTLSDAFSLRQAKHFRRPADRPASDVATRQQHLDPS